MAVSLWSAAQCDTRREISGHRSGVGQNSCLLWLYALSTGKYFPTFRKIAFILDLVVMVLQVIYVEDFQSKYLMVI